MSDRIFISHATEDAEIARNIVEYIEGNTDMKCWIAPRNIPSGQSWITSINEAVKNCAAIVLVLSADAAKSDWVLREISTGITLKKDIFPFKLTDKAADSDLYFSVSTLQWIDGTVNPKSKFPELVEALRGDENKVHTVGQITKKKPSRKWVVPAVSLIVATLLAVLAVVVQPWKQSGEAMAEPIVDSVNSTLELVAGEVEPVATNVQNTSNKVRAAKSADKVETSSKTDLKDVPETDPKGKEEVLPAEPELKPEEKEELQPQAGPSVEDAKEIAYKKKYDKATKFYAAKKYEQAMVLFKELKQEKPQDGSVDAYIASCQQKLRKD